MKLSPLRQVYTWEGPYATVYLEGRAPGADATEQTRLRWKAQRERLQADGASESALNALDDVLAGATAGEEQINGRVLVATGSGVVLDEQWDAALGTGDAAYWTHLPELGSYVREAVRAVRELVVLVDQEGALVRRSIIAEQHDPHQVDSETIEGSAETGVHKPRGGALAHNQIQRHADENLGRNAKDIVSRVSTLAADFAPDVLVLAGEVQARTAVREQLSEDLLEILVETDRGGRDEGASAEALTEELLQIAQNHNERTKQNTAQRLEAGSAHGNSTQGQENVARAAEMGAVDVLVLEDETECAREAFLLHTCAETDASVALVPRGTGVTNGAGALLRFPVTG